MTTKEELKELLRELKTQDNPVRVREAAAGFLKNVDAKTLSLAEQELMQEGVSQEELRGLCSVHLEVLGEELERQKPQLEASHPIGILMDEHKIILQNLEELREIVGQVDAAKELADIQDQRARLKAISHLLLDTESHHQREEEVLFPRLEKCGVTGPPQIMRLEHEELRPKKRRLAELVEQTGNMSFTEFAKELSKVGSYIADVLRDHIYKEDNILYPTALQTLEPEEWSRVLEEFDGIGYCSFTPKVQKNKGNISELN